MICIWVANYGTAPHFVPSKGLQISTAISRDDFVVRVFKIRDRQNSLIQQVASPFSRSVALTLFRRISRAICACSLARSIVRNWVCLSSEQRESGEWRLEGGNEKRENEKWEETPQLIFRHHRTRPRGRLAFTGWPAWSACTARRRFLLPYCHEMEA